MASPTPTPIPTDPEQWVERHGNALFAFAMLRLRDPVLSEDAVQETLLAALRSRERFAGASGERTWLVGILKHKIADQFRRSMREVVADLSAESACEHSEHFRDSGEWVGHWRPELAPVEWERTPASALERSEFWKIIEGCIERLPARLAAAFTLRELDDTDTDEICMSLGVTTNNLFVMLHRARLHMRACVEHGWVRPRAQRH